MSTVSKRITFLALALFLTACGRGFTTASLTEKGPEPVLSATSSGSRSTLPPAPLAPVTARTPAVSAVAFPAPAPAPAAPTLLISGTFLPLIVPVLAATSPPAMPSTAMLAPAASSLCGADVVNHPEIDATATLQSCFDKSNGVINLLPGRYYIRSQLNLINRSHITLKTQNVESGPACLAVGASACAILTATGDNPGPAIFNAVNSDHLTLQYIALDGNYVPRRKLFNNKSWQGGTAYNSKVHGCSDCHFYGFASIHTPQGTGMEFDGDNAIFDNVLFKENGWGIDGYTDDLGWSDGLTVWKSNGIQIRNSTFLDNSDIDLILGSGTGGVIENNWIGNKNNFAFGALMLDNFNGGMPGDFTGTVIRNNTVDCGSSRCGIGINLGPHIWYNSAPITGGLISSNTVRGARQGILTDGVSGTEISGNTLSTSGEFALNQCHTNLLSTTAGDSVNVHDNSASPTLSQYHGCAPTDLAKVLLQQPNVRSEITLAYRDILGRDPDLGGAVGFSNTMNNGASLLSLRTAMAASPEAFTQLDAIYQQILGREIEPGGLASWRDYLANGGSLAQMRILVLLSPEGVQKNSH